MDIGETAEALYQVLTLSDQERSAKWKLARQLVEWDDLNLWFKHHMIRRHTDFKKIRLFFYE
jgi:trehalose-6-phosphate synthase